MPDNLIEYGPNPTVTGKTLYARIANTSAQWWNGTTFENYTSGDYGSYAIALTEQTGGGYFTVATPSILPAGTYTVAIQLQAGGSPAPSDTSPTGAGSCGFHAYWDGSAWHVGPAYMDSLASGEEGNIATAVWSAVLSSGISAEVFLAVIGAAVAGRCQPSNNLQTDNFYDVGDPNGVLSPRLVSQNTLDAKGNVTLRAITVRTNP